jgi:hypothetical protein
VITEHAAPYFDALHTSSPPLTVVDGPVDPQKPPSGPYVVVYVSIDVPDSDYLEEPVGPVRCSAIIHVVAANADACRILAGRVITALLGIVPVVAGRGDCGPITLDDAPPADWDRSTGRQVMDQILVWTYTSLPG